MKSCFQKYYPLLIILATAAVLRINLLLVRGSFWFDEIFSVHFSSLPWLESIKYWTIETNPPLYTLFLKSWLNIVGPHQELLTRLPSVIFSLLTIIVIYLLAEKIFNRFTAIVSSLFIAISGIHIFVGTEARVYSLMGLLTAFSYYLFYLIFFKKQKNNWLWPIYLITNLCLIYSHLTTLTIFLIQFLMIILIKPEKKDFKKYLLGNFTIGLLWLIWFIPSFASKLNKSSLTAWYFDPQAEKVSDIFTLIISNFVNSSLSGLSFTLTALAIFSGLYFFIQQTLTNKGEEKNKYIFVCLWGLLPVIFGSILGVFTSKYFLSASLGIYLMVAYSLSHLATNKKKNWATIAAIIILMSGTTLDIASTKIFSWHDYLSYIEKNETKKSLIAVTPFNEQLSIKYYFKGQSPVKGIYLNNDNFPLDERIVKYNWNKQVTSEKELKKWFETNLKNVEILYYFQYTGNYDWTHQILLAKGWTITKQIVNPGYINLNMFEFHAPNFNSSTTSTPSFNQKN